MSYALRRHDPLLGPHRPDRTSQRERRHHPAPVVYSRVTLRDDLERVITVWHRPGDSPALAITVFRDREKMTRLLVRADELAVLERALRAAGDPDLRGRGGQGRIPLGELELWIWAVREDDRPPAVCIGRVRVADRRYVGRATTIAGDELAALANAARDLRAATGYR